MNDKIEATAIIDVKSGNADEFERLLGDFEAKKSGRRLY